MLSGRLCLCLCCLCCRAVCLCHVCRRCHRVCPSFLCLLSPSHRLSHVVHRPFAACRLCRAALYRRLLLCLSPCLCRPCPCLCSLSLSLSAVSLCPSSLCPLSPSPASLSPLLSSSPLLSVRSLDCTYLVTVLMLIVVRCGLEVIGAKLVMRLVTRR